MTIRGALIFLLELVRVVGCVAVLCGCVAVLCVLYLISFARTAIAVAIEIILCSLVSAALLMVLLWISVMKKEETYRSIQT